MGNEQLNGQQDWQSKQVQAILNSGPSENYRWKHKKMNYLNINDSQRKVLTLAAFCFSTSYKRMHQR